MSQLYAVSRRWFLCLAPVMVLVAPLHAILTSSDLATYEGWTEVSYINQSDYYTDQQTGQPEGDIVGNTGGLSPGEQGAIFTKYYNGGDDANLSDDQIGFRMRVSADSQSAGWDTIGLFGLNIGGDDDIDLFVGVAGGSKGGIIIYNPGTDLNISPSTTSAEIHTTLLSSSDPNYNNYFAFEEVSDTNDAYIAEDPTNRLNATYTDLDSDGNTDYYMSFYIDVADLVLASQEIALTNSTTEELTAGSEVTIVAMTTNSKQSFNQDLAGHQGTGQLDQLGPDGSGVNWGTLGAESSGGNTITGGQVPEPSSFALLIGIFATAIVARRRVA